MKTWFKNLSPKAAALGLGVLAVAIRLGLWFVYLPQEYSDTNAYWRLARYFAGEYARYDATRPPAYPYYLALTGQTAAGAVAWQLALGVVLTLLFFYIGWQLSGKVWLGLVAGLAYTLNLQQLFFEYNVLTETLATLFVTLALASLLMKRADTGQWGVALGLAVVASLAWLTRFQFIFLPFWLGLGLAWKGVGLKFEWRKLAAVWGVSLLILAGWVGFIYGRFGIVSLSPMGGLSLMQHAGGWVEYASDEHAAFREVFLDNRAAQIEETGSASNTIWRAMPDLQAELDMGFYQVADEAMAVAGELIVAYPDLYLKSVVGAWVKFWKAPLYWNPADISVGWLGAGLAALGTVTRYLLVAANFIFLAATVALVWPGWRRRVDLGDWEWALVIAIWGLSIFQALTENGDNQRYLVPMQTLVVVWVKWVGAKAWAGRDQ